SPLGAHRPRRVPGLDLDLEPAPHPTGPVDLRRALQHRPAPPRHRPRHPHPTGTSRRLGGSDQTNRPPRRPPPRISTSRLIKHLTSEIACLHPSPTPRDNGATSHGRTQPDWQDSTSTWVRGQPAITPGQGTKDLGLG